MTVSGCSGGAKEVAVTIASVKLLGCAANFTISVASMIGVHFYIRCMKSKLSITKRKSEPAIFMVD